VLIVVWAALPDVRQGQADFEWYSRGFCRRHYGTPRRSRLGTLSARREVMDIRQGLVTLRHGAGLGRRRWPHLACGGFGCGQLRRRRWRWRFAAAHHHHEDRRGACRETWGRSGFTHLRMPEKAPLPRRTWRPDPGRSPHRRPLGRLLSDRKARSPSRGWRRPDENPAPENGPGHSGE